MSSSRSTLFLTACPVRKTRAPSSFMVMRAFFLSSSTILTSVASILVFIRPPLCPGIVPDMCPKSNYPCPVMAARPPSPAPPLLLPALRPSAARPAFVAQLTADGPAAKTGLFPAHPGSGHEKSPADRACLSAGPDEADGSAP